MKLLRSLKVAKSYLRQAKARLDDAKEAYVDKNYPYVVRLSQECVELCIKASLKIVGIEYPKVHEVSDVLTDVSNRFPEWFKAEISFLRKSSKVLCGKREVSFYGGEEALLAPEEVINKEDAKDAVERAEKVYKLCNNLLLELKEAMGPN